MAAVADGAVDDDFARPGLQAAMTSSTRTGTCVPAGVLPLARRWASISGYAARLCSLYFCA